MWEVKTEKWIMDIWYDQHQLSFTHDIVDPMIIIDQLQKQFTTK